MLTTLLINVIIMCLIAWLVYAYLIPILPPPFNTIAYVVLVIVIIVWLLQLVEPNLLLGSLDGGTVLHYAYLTGNEIIL